MTSKFTPKRVVRVTTRAGGSENDDHNVIPTEIPTTTSIDSNIITLTDAIGSPEMPTRELIESEIGLPATHD